MISHNILVKEDRDNEEAVASRSPLSEYEKTKESQERAIENATFNFTKRRGIEGEVKQ